jgi:hypothetical protein
MKKLLVLLVISASTPCFAQEQQLACMRKFDEQFSAVGAEMANFAGSLNYKSLMERATQCIQGGRCIKVELAISLTELLVDEEVIRLQREKLSRLKSYFSTHKSEFISNDYCSVLSTFPAVMIEMRDLNNAQLERFKLLLHQHLEPLLQSQR